MKKRLIILCDGTWNRADQVHSGKLGPTNVAQLNELVVKGVTNGVEQIPRYHKGIGTGRSNRLLGGATGWGLGRHVRDVYTWLCEDYRPGDEIFLFGFSRGAYTARSAVGLIRTCGIVQRDADGGVSEKLVHRAFDIYRGAPSDGDGPDYQAAKDFRKQYAVEEETHIRCIGVWDTVGALGIPLSGARWNWFNKKNQFHNVTLSSRVEAAYQALAIDEHRGPFVPAVWKQSEDRAKADMKLEQAWFPGAHSDVGGGYSHHDLSDLTLRWMVARARAEGLVVDPTYVPAPDTETYTTLSTVHDSRSWIYRRIRPYDRAIGVVDPEHEAVCVTSKVRVEGTSGFQPPKSPYT
ncbi:MAG: hypothetical protein QOK15_3420, partial [Nocardioidaceae bacterium]|nr:hypothetical protein [Nocardioidaceae bacterium]